MKNFFQIVKFEYKKIFSKKLNLIILGIFFIFLAINNNLGFFNKIEYNGEYITEYEYYKKYANFKKEGIYLDKNSIKQINEKIKEGLKNEENTEINKYGKTVFNEKARIKYEMPYAEISYFLRTYLNPENEISERKYMLNYTEQDFDNIYNKRLENFKKFLSSYNLQKQENEKILQLNSEIKTPFYFEDYTLYSKLFKDLGIIMIFILLILIMCLSPIFSREKTDKTYPLIAISKYGKNKVVLAKLFVIITFSLCLTFFVHIISFLNLGIIYGFSGFKTNAQFLIGFYSPYPLTVGQTLIIKFGINMLISLISALAIGFISSISKNNFISIVVCFVILYLPSFLTPILKSTNILPLIRNLIKLQPINLTDFYDIFDIHMFNIFNNSFEIYKVIPFIYIFIIFILVFVILKIEKTYK